MVFLVVCVLYANIDQSCTTGGNGEAPVATAFLTLSYAGSISEGNVTLSLYANRDIARGAAKAEAVLGKAERPVTA